MNNGVISIRVDKTLKKESEAIFNELGFGLTAGITMYLRKVVRSKSIPFSLEIEEPNEETLAAFKELEDIKAGKVKVKKYANVNELRKDLKV